MSILSVYTGSSSKDSGGMKAGVPGHVVIIAKCTLPVAIILDIPKSVTLARPANSRTLLLERSR